MLNPVLRKDGAITAGKRPRPERRRSRRDFADAGRAEEHGVAPIAWLAGYGIAAVESGLFGLGAVPAIHLALERAGVGQCLNVPWVHMDDIADVT